ncbi:hypothetical protein [Polaromonas sp.]|uniref:hypothetical protein n=1 Tax=Polaromonas sp. TaxID=1869339 RepID=UPI00356979E5
MPANTAPIFPVTPYAAFANLSAQTACTTRGPTATAGLAAANIVVLVPADSVNGRKIDSIRVKASSTSITAPTAAQLVTIWQHNGTTAFPVAEIQVDLQTPATTSPSFERLVRFDDLVLPAAHALYVSTTITTAAATTALTVKAVGGDY